PLLERMSTRPHVVAASPAIYEQVLVSRGARAKGVVLKGVLPEYERKVSDLLGAVKLGSAESLAGTPDVKQEGAASPRDAAPKSEADTILPWDRRAEMAPIILGKGLAEDLGATVGSVVMVTSPQGELTPFGIVPKYVRFHVTGIFDSGFYDYDTAWAFTRLEDAQRLFGLGDVVTVIEFKVDDIYRAGEIGATLEQKAGKGFGSTNWMEQNRALFRALRLERVVTFITIGLIVTVAALNILISLIMMVMEKTRDIAILMSMGARRAQVRRIFVWQGLLIGLLGTALGLALGYALSWAGGHYKWISLSPEIYAIDYVPFAPRMTDGVVVALVAIGISFVATLYPSWSAARVLPAEALRYE
ncbi:MAG: FtsX-like permease family protein, partial [Terriglobales bacterium]